jgi:poly-beta-1,6-N-acetyl-D-glucosamine biosynthesis protein PgaD
MKNPLIIESPELQTNVQRYGWSSVTLFFWMLYVYLWLPFITLIAWWFGLKIFHRQIIELHGYEGVIDKLGLYSIIIIILSIVLIGWARIENYRFKDSVRRVGRNNVSVGEVAKTFNLQESQLTQLMQKKSVIVYFSEKGQLSGIAEYH